MREFSREQIVERVTELIEPCTGTLITMAPDGCPRARQLEDHNPYDGFAFWFATHARTRKVAEIEACAPASIYYQPPGVEGYICIMGMARIRRDEEARRFIWRDEWTEYYGGPLAEEYVPIEIVPHRVEYYDPKAEAVAEDGFGPVVVELQPATSFQ